MCRATECHAEGCGHKYYVASTTCLPAHNINLCEQIKLEGTVTYTVRCPRCWGNYIPPDRVKYESKPPPWVTRAMGGLFWWGLAGGGRVLLGRKVNLKSCA